MEPCRCEALAMDGKNLQILVEHICGAESFASCSVMAILEQKETPDPFTASAMDSSGEVTDDYNKQLKQINHFHHLFTDFKARSGVCMN